MPIPSNMPFPPGVLVSSPGPSQPSRSGKYDHSVDVYAFGVLLWYILSNDVRMPDVYEQCDNKNDLWKCVKRGEMSAAVLGLQTYVLPCIVVAVGEEGGGMTKTGTVVEDGNLFPRDGNITFYGRKWCLFRIGSAQHAELLQMSWKATEMQEFLQKPISRNAKKDIACGA